MKHICKGDEFFDEPNGTLMRVDNRNKFGVWTLLASDEYDEDAGDFVNFKERHWTDAEMRIFLREKHICFDS